MATQEFVAGPSGTDQTRLEAMVVECLPSVQRWAHGRLPPAVRGSLDTCDLVQEVARRMLSKRGAFDVRHPFAVEGYMRRALRNLVCDHVRRIRRQPIQAEMPSEDTLRSAADKTPFDAMLASEVEARYRAALERLRPRERDLVVARIEHGTSAAEIQRQFGFTSIGATYAAVSRALARLGREVASRKPASGQSRGSVNDCGHPER